jgi:hypothetical protein
MATTGTTIKIEFFQDGSDDAPLILIWGYDISATRELFHAFRSSCDGQEQEIAIHKLAQFCGVDGLELYAHISDTEDGLTRRQGNLVFDWNLSHLGWQRVGSLLSPFCDRVAAPGSFQWLDDSSKISVIFSTERGW